jgi:hypothetical protein
LLSQFSEYQNSTLSVKVRATADPGWEGEAVKINATNGITLGDVKHTKLEINLYVEDVDIPKYLAKTYVMNA